MNKATHQHTLGRFIRRAKGEQIKAKLHGQGPLKIEILVCPAGGEFEVIAQTKNQHCTYGEFVGSLINLMAEEL